MGDKRELVLKKIMNHGSPSKLMCVKIIKRLTGLGLRDSKDIADETDGGGVVSFPVIYGDELLVHNTHLVDEFANCGYEITPDRETILEGLLGDEYVYIVDLLNRDISYLIDDGSYAIFGDVLHLKIVSGVKMVNGIESNINAKEVKVSLDSVSLETNSPVND